LTIVSKVEEYTKLFEVLNSMIKQVRRFASYLSAPAGHFSAMLYCDVFFKAVFPNLFSMEEPLK
jgi:hypothetical protein